MTDLVEWLLAQYDAAERDARTAQDRSDGDLWVVTGADSPVGVDYAPELVLADLAAKRRIVELHRHEAKGPGPVLHDGSRDLNEGVFGCVICSCVDEDPGWYFTGGWCQTVRLLAPALHHLRRLRRALAARGVEGGRRGRGSETSVLLRLAGLRPVDLRSGALTRLAGSVAPIRGRRRLGRGNARTEQGEQGSEDGRRSVPAGGVRGCAMVGHGLGVPGALACETAS